MVDPKQPPFWNNDVISTSSDVIKSYFQNFFVMALIPLELRIESTDLQA